MRHIMLATLFTGFLRLGATAYGGPAMMAHLRQDFVGKRRWLSEEEFKEGMALCHMIPGATMVQMAAYVGYRHRQGRGRTHSGRRRSRPPRDRIGGRPGGWVGLYCKSNLSQTQRS